MSEEKKAVKVTIELDPRVYQALKVICALRQTTTTATVRSLIAYFIQQDGVLSDYSVDVAKRKVAYYTKLGGKNE